MISFAKLFFCALLIYFNTKNLNANNIYSYKNIHVENEDKDSYLAKDIIIKYIINDVHFIFTFFSHIIVKQLQ